MESHNKRLAEMFAAIGGGFTNWWTANAHDLFGSIAYYGGTVVVVLSGISFSMDIYKKWKNRNDK